MKRRGFTLIELLVVIAIIAILAAILFPVFAQAKLAAKKTASLSNIKQIELSSLMYSNDYDDVVPLAYETNTYSTWSAGVQPYVKSWDLFFSPLGGPRVLAAFTGPNTTVWQNWQYTVQYGYNASYMNRLSPAGGSCSGVGTLNTDGNAFGPPISSTSAAAPAETVEFVESGQDAPNDNVGTLVVYPPGAQLANDVCTYGDWGANSAEFYAYTGNTGVTQLGFVKPRENGSVVAFMDGHAKLQRNGDLAAGTNWFAGQAYGTSLIIDRTKYIWDLQ
jgi:prepilin-type N-terminal cleavage/methylation domain-containing protein